MRTRLLSTPWMSASSGSSNRAGSFWSRISVPGSCRVREGWHRRRRGGAAPRAARPGGRRGTGRPPRPAVPRSSCCRRAFLAQRGRPVPQDGGLQLLSERVLRGALVGRAGRAVEDELVVLDHPLAASRVRLRLGEDAGGFLVAGGLEGGTQRRAGLGMAVARPEQGPQDRLDLVGQRRALAPVRDAAGRDEIVGPAARDLGREAGIGPGLPCGGRRPGAVAPVSVEQVGETLERCLRGSVCGPLRTIAGDGLRFAVRARDKGAVSSTREGTMSLHHHLVHLAVVAAYTAITVLHLAEGAGPMPVAPWQSPSPMWCWLFLA